MFVSWVVSLSCGLVDRHKRCGETSSELKVEAVGFSEALVSTYNSAWRYKPEDQHRHLLRRENQKSLMRFEIHDVKSHTRSSLIICSADFLRKLISYVLFYLQIK
jgi:hypothetical protein